MRYHNLSNPNSELINNTPIPELYYDLADNGFNDDDDFTNSVKAYIDEVADIYVVERAFDDYIIKTIYTFKKKTIKKDIIIVLTNIITSLVITMVFYIIYLLVNHINFHH